MWNVLYPNWETFKVYFFIPEAERILEYLQNKPFEIKCLKTPPSHRNFILKFLSEDFSPLFLKAFIPRFFKKNRVKNYFKLFKILKDLQIPLVEPYFLFWKNPQIAFIKDEPFYGGIIFPCIEKGFLKKEDLFLDSQKEKVNYELIKNLVLFLYNLHEKGIYLRDTKFNNFYHTSYEGFKIFDLDGTKFYKRPLSKLERLKDLSTLAMSLEWEKIKDAKTLVLGFYRELFPEINKKDFEKFDYLVNLKRKKREKKLLKFQEQAKK